MSIPRRILAANWKMSLSGADSCKLAAYFSTLSESLNSTELWIAPSAPFLSAVRDAAGTRVRVGAQNVHSQPFGAFTGEISAPMICEVGCSFAITGHSERRHQFAESNELVTSRTLAGLAAGLSIILCVGETLAEREAERTNAVIDHQLDAVLRGVQDATHFNRLIIAYEPVWAIGTGKVAEHSQIHEAHRYIRSRVSTHTAAPVPVLYGGSVAPATAPEIYAIPEVSGCLVGGASTQRESWRALVELSELSPRSSLSV